MRRRDFIALVGGSAAWPLAADAQSTIPVIGFLGSESLARTSTLIQFFRQGLAEQGLQKAEMLGSSIAGRKVAMTGYPSWQLIWFAMG
jgi:hypothetical protein